MFEDLYGFNLTPITYYGKGKKSYRLLDRLDELGSFLLGKL